MDIVIVIPGHVQGAKIGIEILLRGVGAAVICGVCLECGRNLCLILVGEGDAHLGGFGIHDVVLQDCLLDLLGSVLCIGLALLNAAVRGPVHDLGLVLLIQGQDHGIEPVKILLPGDLLVVYREHHRLRFISRIDRSHIAGGSVAVL